MIYLLLLFVYIANSLIVSISVIFKFKCLKLNYSRSIQVLYLDQRIYCVTRLAV
jgi:hypothetical protein